MLMTLNLKSVNNSLVFNQYMNSLEFMNSYVYTCWKQKVIGTLKIPNSLTSF